MLRTRKMNANRWKTFLLFIIPAMIIYTIFLVYPFFGGTIPMSFTELNIVKNQSSFVGIKNFATIFSSSDFWASFWVTIKYVIAVVLSANIIALILAILIESVINKFVKSLARTLFFVPYIVSGLIVAYLWRFMFTNVWPELFNSLGLEGVAKISWFGNYSVALLALIIESVWKQLGFLILLYIAGLQAIPSEVIEASYIDGCNGWQRNIRVVVPMLMSTISVNLFLTLTDAFKQFDLAYANNGGPGSATALLTFRIYQQAFVNTQYGTACAMALVLMAIIAVFTLAQQKLTSSREVEL